MKWLKFILCLIGIHEIEPMRKDWVRYKCSNCGKEITNDIVDYED